LRELLQGQLLGVLGTQHHGAPYTSLVAFTAIDDTRVLLFATSRSTRKFRNLQMEPRASLLIDNRDNTPGDFADAAAATAVGTCVELTGAAREEMAPRLVDRHPQLAAFVGSPSCALMALEVEVYMLVWRFQHVTEIRPVR
jgi:nitroimidazol reductase NimA-like FMN-containing flavoprotein (pyridoxamine 5'-phosphate oxidase superfamily)